MPGTVNAASRLGTFVATTTAGELAPEVGVKAAICLLDSIGLALAARDEPTAVAARSGGFVAVGSDGDQASAWISPDGRTWRQADLPIPIGSASAVLQHVASSGRTVVPPVRRTPSAAVISK